ncbi:MAG: flagellar M-ring protein FliF [Gammaproteobacteria bacterium]|nr:flagellar M-ring protein FliF [Gammaproteobacteria bacterium]MCB1872383.1 flagellar M-ring protein FliF [Gammaproteobacteria bacterium]MCB1881228.1 flagellar M-ring protein FliF [Gammaproteobacteria bacterium]MCB1904485.1 flagellar M-ring protein FliF [Gammaproteobacteria bacterium]
MENAKKETEIAPQQQLQNLGQNPMVRQLGVMIGIAASVALGVAVVLWSQTPSYSMLYGNLAQKDASEVVEALTQAAIEFKIDETTGAVMVETGKLQEARMKLAGLGLPHSDSLGFELLQQETGFGTSRALEAARFHRALEGELARTITTLATIESARVHLATPKQSVFLRDHKKPSASVVVKLRSGRTLDKSQVAAISHLVASSVPELEIGEVTVVDHKGEMLSSPKESNEMLLSASQFEYSKKQEEHYRQRVENILAPILGLENIRAQVTAELDFTVTEQTAERYNPDLPALRSEQVDEQASRLGAVQGVPGALSNQPPAAGSAPEQAGGEAAGAESENQLNSSKRSTRNFELDKTISHTRLSSGTVRRLSVAVVVNDKSSVNAAGELSVSERTPEEISRITQLVKEAIGFNAARGDSVRVINAAFMAPEEMQPLPDLPLWEQPWVWDLAKQIGGVLLVLILIFFVLRPTMHRLTSPPAALKSQDDNEAGEGADGERVGADGALLAGGSTAFRLPGPEAYQETLEAARQMVTEDPKRVAQVVKSWISEDAG